LLMADADGASRFEDLESLWEAMDALTPDDDDDDDDGPAIVVGSRAHLVGSAAVVKRSLLRNILMHGLHLILRIVGVGHIHDTQCGFKLFSRSAARQIFPNQHYRLGYLMWNCCFWQNNCAYPLQKSQSNGMKYQGAN